METVRYWVGVLLVVSLPPAILWWFVVHPFMQQSKTAAVKKRTLIFVIIALSSVNHVGMERCGSIPSSAGSAPLRAALLEPQFLETKPLFEFQRF